jgi:Flp pilus assembly protein TadG
MKRSERGAALVEMAFVLPILVALVMGIYEFGRGYHAKVELTGAVREGARAVALGQPAGPAVVNASPGLNPAPAVFVDSTCPASAAPGTNAVVRATHLWTYNVFFFQGSVTISAKGVMRCGL